MMQDITYEIWRDKYRFGDEADIAATRDRVIDGVYAKDTEVHREIARELIHKEHIVPAGRIHAGAGTNKRVTLLNCFVSPEIQDSMETDPMLPGKGIMDNLKVGALTQQMGGGIGMDFCLAPETLVLRSDLHWVKVEEVNVGDELIGFDED